MLIDVRSIIELFGSVKVSMPGTHPCILRHAVTSKPLKDQDGNLTLHLAARGGHSGVVASLVEAMAPVTQLRPWS